MALTRTTTMVTATAITVGTRTITRTRMATCAQVLAHSDMLPSGRLSHSRTCSHPEDVVNVSSGTLARPFDDDNVVGIRDGWLSLCQSAVSS